MSFSEWIFSIGNNKYIKKSDSSFVAILNIVKQQDARIQELEMRLSKQ